MTAAASAMTTRVPRHPSRPTSFAIPQPAPSARFAALSASSSLVAALLSPDDVAPLPLTPSPPDPEVLPDEGARVVERGVPARGRGHGPPGGGPYPCGGPG